MKRNLRFLPEVEHDAISGYLWYEERTPGLGDEFLRVFYACAREIAWNPLMYPKVYLEFRRRLDRIGDRCGCVVNLLCIFEISVLPVVVADMDDIRKINGDGAARTYPSGTLHNRSVPCPGRVCCVFQISVEGDHLF